jgi:hypothetical protein
VNSFFLGCFAFGLIFTVASFLLGAFGSGEHLHLPDFNAHHGAGAPAGDHGAYVSPFNLSTIAAFVTWFGGAGWLLTRYSSLTALFITLIASVAGTVGGGIVFITLSRYVFPRLTVMRPEDYQVQGLVGRLASAIREGEGGTGEVVYAVAGARRVDGARSVTGEALEKGAEVVILRVEKGIAYVQRWEQFASQNQLPAGGAGET